MSAWAFGVGVMCGVLAFLVCEDDDEKKHYQVLSVLYLIAAGVWR